MSRKFTKYLVCYILVLGAAFCLSSIFSYFGALKSTKEFNPNGYQITHLGFPFSYSEEVFASFDVTRPDKASAVVWDHIFECRLTVDLTSDTGSSNMFALQIYDAEGLPIFELLPIIHSNNEGHGMAFTYWNSHDRDTSFRYKDFDNNGIYDFIKPYPETEESTVTLLVDDQCHKATMQNGNAMLLLLDDSKQIAEWDGTSWSMKEERNAE